MEEIWKDIAYNTQISNIGRIRNKSTKRIRPSYPVSKRSNYHYVMLRMRPKTKSKAVILHRLVAQAFIPNPDNKPQVNHIDGNKMNNCAGNLEWTTASENICHAFKLGLKKGLSGITNPMCTLKEHQVIEMRKLRDVYGLSLKLIAGLYNVNANLVGLVCRRTTWKHIPEEYVL